jgi:hypothetical protein
VLESVSIFRFSTTVFFFSTVCTARSSWLASSSKSGFGSLGHVIIVQLQFTAETLMMQHEQNEHDDLVVPSLRICKEDMTEFEDSSWIRISI